MGKNLSQQECRSMFSDRFATLSMKEIGSELQHFRKGTAPENPSHLVNQVEAKAEIQKRFNSFTDENGGNAEIIFLHGHYGNGKSHFIRSIYCFLSRYENVSTRVVTLKSSGENFFRIILACISQQKIRECARFIYSEAVNLTGGNDTAELTNTIDEKFGLNAVQANLVIDIANSGDIERQSKAIAILKNNYLSSYLKDYGLKKGDLDDGFYMNVVSIIALYLQKTDQYLVAVFDEFEHVFSWGDKERKRLFSEIKYFTDYINQLGRMMFIFAITDSVEWTIEKDDPALWSRIKGETCFINKIESTRDARALFQMILKRYEKYHNIMLQDYSDDILERVDNSLRDENELNYRIYTQKMMYELDRYREELYKGKNQHDKRDTLGNGNVENLRQEKSSDGEWIKWRQSSSVSRKTLIADWIEKMIVLLGGRLIKNSRRRGEIFFFYRDLEYHAYEAYTDYPSIGSFNSKLSEINETEDYVQVLIIYPKFEGEITNEVKYRTVLYNESSLHLFLDSLYQPNEKDLDDYLNYLSAGIE